MLSLEIDRQWTRHRSYGSIVRCEQTALRCGGGTVGSDLYPATVRAMSRPAGRIEHRNQIFSSRQDEDVGLIRIVVLRQAHPVLRVIEGRDRLQPKPKGPLPEPES